MDCRRSTPESGLYIRTKDDGVRLSLCVDGPTTYSWPSEETSLEIVTRIDVCGPGKGSLDIIVHFPWCPPTQTSNICFLPPGLPAPHCAEPPTKSCLCWQFWPFACLFAQRGLLAQGIGEGECVLHPRLFFCFFSVYTSQRERGWPVSAKGNCPVLLSF